MWNEFSLLWIWNSPFKVLYENTKLSNQHYSTVLQAGLALYLWQRLNVFSLSRMNDMYVILIKRSLYCPRSQQFKKIWLSEDTKDNKSAIWSRFSARNEMTCSSSNFSSFFLISWGYIHCCMNHVLCFHQQLWTHYNFVLL
jgi:hypothetical protein